MHSIRTSPRNIFTNVSLVYDINSSEFVHTDQEFANLYGLEAGEITPITVSALVHPDDLPYVQEKFSELSNASFRGSIEFRVVVKEIVHRVRVTPFIVNIGERNLVAASVEDFTSEWNNSESIRRYANKKNSILNMLTHDLRGPLNIANTLARNVELKINDPYVLKLTRSISGILNQSIELIASLIDRELLETVEVELDVKRVNIVSKLMEYIEECKRSEAAAHRTFNFKYSREQIYIELDEAKFMQILNNLVTNALKFTHPGGIISIEVTDKEDSVMFNVKDNGIGIPRVFHSSLFDKFTNARRKGLNGEPTIGLGLSIVKLLVDWHKGQIWFESEENEGTSFYFEFPKRRQD